MQTAACCEWYVNVSIAPNMGDWSGFQDGIALNDKAFNIKRNATITFCSD